MNVLGSGTERMDLNGRLRFALMLRTKYSDNVMLHHEEHTVYWWCDSQKAPVYIVHCQSINEC